MGFSTQTRPESTFMLRTLSWLMPFKYHSESDQLSELWMPISHPNPLTGDGNMPELDFIRLDKIRQNKVALRDVNRQGEDFLELVQAIRQQGVLSAISLRKKPDPGDDKEYELVDGLQRFTASTEVGTGVIDQIEDPNRKGQWIAQGKYIEVDDGKGGKKRVGVIPAQIIERDQADTMIAQMIGNAHRIETKPIEYMKTIIKYLGYNPAMTGSELALKMGKSPEWLEKILSLGKLSDQIKPLVNEGNIPLVNAYNLAKLPPEEQLLWSDRAQTQKADEFTAQVLKRVKEIRDAHRKGESASPETFQPVRHLRKKPEIESEATNPKLLAPLMRDAEVTKGLKANAQGLEEAALRGAVFALDWATNYESKITGGSAFP